MGKNMKNEQFQLFFALFWGFEYIFKYKGTLATLLYIFWSLPAKCYYIFLICIHFRVIILTEILKINY